MPERLLEKEAPAPPPESGTGRVLALENHSANVLAWLTFAVGVLTLLAGVPLLRRRFAGALLPLDWLTPGSVTRQTSHVLLAIVAVFLIFLSSQLRRRKKRAWQVSVVLTAVLLPLHVLRGGGIIGAIIVTSLLVLLIIGRRTFTARSDPPSLLRLFRFVPAYLLLVLMYGVIAMSLESSRIYLQPDFPGMVQTVLRGLVGLPGPYLYEARSFARVFPATLWVLGVSGLIAVAVLLFRPLVQRPHHSDDDWELARTIVKKFGTDTLAYFALRPDKSFFFSSDGKAMIAYGYMGGYALASGDPIGAPESILLVIDEFTAMCRERAWGVAFLAVRESDAALYESYGMHCQYLGDEAVIDCDRFTLDGRPIRKVRQSCTRLQKAGYTFELVSAATIGPELRQRLKAITEKWRGNAPERGFTMALGGDINTDDPDCLVSIAKDTEGFPRAFLHLVPCYGDSPGYSLDLMRRDPATPNGVVEYLVSMTVLELKERGFHRLSLNFAAFARLMDDDRDFTPVQKMQRFIVKRLNPYFQMESLYVSNKKYFPDFVPRVIYYDELRKAARIAILYLEAEELLRIPFLGSTLVPMPGDRRAGGSG